MSNRVDALLDQFEATLRDVTTMLTELKPKMESIPVEEWSGSQMLRCCQIMAKFSEDMGQASNLKDFFSAFKGIREDEE
jgi:hypothetical protein